jgi:protein TonB
MTDTADLLLRKTRPRRAGLGWTASAACVGLALSGLAALATAIAPPGESLGTAPQPMPLLMTAPAPALAALSEPAPLVAASAPLPDPTPPPVDETALAPAPVDPVAQPVTAPLEAPRSEAAPTADLALPDPAPPRPDTRPKRRPEPKPPEAKPPEPARPQVVQRAPAPQPAPSAPAASPAPQAQAAASAGTGQRAVANYGASVMKQIRNTRRQAAPGRGTVVVGFRIAGDGGLASVSVVTSSGNPDLDSVALDHIRRAAPFPAPPEGANRSFAFEFVGR